MEYDKCRKRTYCFGYIYICLIDAPGIGTKVLKAAIFTAEERIDF
jgi:hypothetical protein